MLLWMGDVVILTGHNSQSDNKTSDVNFTFSINFRMKRQLKITFQKANINFILLFLF